jgi:hypothetical protein
MKRFVVALDGILDTESCRHLIDKFEHDRDRYLGRTAAGLMLDRKRSLDLDLRPPDWTAELTLLHGAVQRAVQEYAKRNASLASVEAPRCSGFRMRRYDAPGGGFDWHIDSYNRSVATRILSCVMYLNETEGEGATDFLHQECSVLPATGRAVLFPSTFEYVHRSRAMNVGSKYVIVTFVEHGSRGAPDDETI